jgi:2-dehydro-3-deoxyphosphooctonate aldolase (KDO 8-P synthase)
MEISKLGKGGKFFVIAGPCVIEGTDFLLKTAKTIKGIADEFGVPLVFKSSYDKANRTSGKGFRGPGLKKGLADLALVKRKLH